jgi:viroplasmin and RNaseH domain-containing protein
MHFMVFKGRERGIFHQCYCLKSIANFNGAMFKGFDSLDEALRALSGLWCNCCNYYMTDLVIY